MPGTYLADLRRQHGSPEPYDVRMWCLGNEIDGPWQLGHKSAEEYGRLASNVAREAAVRSNLELVVCGSSGRQMPTFGSWEATVLEQSYDEVDFISAHAYYENLGDSGGFLASSVDMEDFITDVIASADHVRGKLKRSKRISISFDEWNVWYLSRVPEQVAGSWEEVRRVSEDAYTVADANGSARGTLQRSGRGGFGICGRKGLQEKVASSRAPTSPSRSNFDPVWSRI